MVSPEPCPWNPVGTPTDTNKQLYFTVYELAVVDLGGLGYQGRAAARSYFRLKAALYSISCRNSLNCTACCSLLTASSLVIFAGVPITLVSSTDAFSALSIK